MHSSSSVGMKALGLSSLEKIVRILREKTSSKNIIFILAARFWTATWTKEGRGFFFTVRSLGVSFDRVLEAKVYLSSFLKIFLGRNPCISFPKNIDTSVIENLYISWALPSDLDSLKSNNDRYFGYFPRTSRDVLVCWILGKPKQEFIDLLEKENIAYIVKRYDFARFRSIAKILSLAFRGGGILGSIRALVGISGEMVSGVSLAYQLKDVFQSKSCFRTLSLPYEAQPIQNTWIYFLKQSHPELLVYGYIHSSMSAFPSYYFKRLGAVDKLFVHGSAYKRVLVDHLGWEDDEVQVISSLRFKKKPQTDYAGRIYIPYDFADPGLILREIEHILRFVGSGFRRPEVRLHPVKSNLAPHIEIKANIEKLLDEVSQNFDAKGRDLTVVVGLTAALLEALENDVEVIQIVSDPAIETYSSEIWSELESNPISEYSTKYSLKVKGAFVVYGESRTIPITELVAR